MLSIISVEELLSVKNVRSNYNGYLFYFRSLSPDHMGYGIHDGFGAILMDEMPTLDHLEFGPIVLGKRFHRRLARPNIGGIH